MKLLNTHIMIKFMKQSMIVVLFIAAFGLSNQLYGQQKDTIIAQVDSLKLKPLESIEKDSIKGILNKIRHFLKFRKNRESKRIEQIHNYLDSLIVKGELRVDSLNLNLMIDEINKAFVADSIRIHRNESNIEISQVEIDSLTVKIGLLLDQLATKELYQRLKLSDSIETSIKDIKAVQYALGNEKRARVESLYVKEDLKLFKKLLAVKNDMQIIGWHNAWNDVEYKSYNYNYLSAINLYGYDLHQNGSAKNKKVLNDFQKPGGVIDYAKSNGCGIVLTVYNKNPQEIHNFLNNKSAQDSLIYEVQRFDGNNQLAGLNIYFEDVLTEDHQRFVAFINKMAAIQTIRSTPLTLYLTIPSIYEEKSTEKVNAYDFIYLNEFVDYYIVLTDRMTSYYNHWAQSASPLRSVKDNVKGSIESTINFYSNGKIPVSKLIMAVSYLGLEWDVNSPDGRVINKRGYDIEYREIMYSYMLNKNLRDKIHISYDSVQEAALLNITNYQGLSSQIYFEDARSLGQKYKWALNNNLGGVSIRGLGYDDGFSELWNVLGTHLMKVDTLFIDGGSGPVFRSKTDICSFKEFKEDLNEFNLFKWADLIEKFQKYDSIDHIPSDSIPLSDYGFIKFVTDDVQWASVSEDHLYFKTRHFNLEEDMHELDSKFVLENKETCLCLLERWVYYFHVSRGLAIVCFVMAIVLSLRIRWLDRFRRGGKRLRILLKLLVIIFSLLCIFFSLFWAYMNPNWEEFGASNNGDVSILLYLMLPVIGLLLGIYIKRVVDKGKFVKKNLP